MTIDASTGIFRFAPRVSQGKQAFTVSVTVSDGQGGSDTKSFQLVVPAIPVANRTGTTLHVVGTADADNVVVNQVGGRLAVYANVDQVRVKIFDGTGIQAIQVNGRAGNDVIVLNPSVLLASTLTGGIGNDVLRGGSGRDTIVGGDHDDQIFGNAGDDLLLGGMGTDLLDGRLGNDVLSGNAGRDTLRDHSGNDILLGGDGFDTLTDSKGHDMLIGSSMANESNARALQLALIEWLRGNSKKSLAALGRRRDDRKLDVFGGNTRGDLRQQ